MSEQQDPVPTHCLPGEEPPQCRAVCTKNMLTGEILDPDCFRGVA